MKIESWICSLFVIFMLLFVFGCTKKEVVAVPVDTGTVTDIDGNIYHVIKIGTQTWMAENLKVTKYNTGSPIPNVTDAIAWQALTTDAYCWYNNDAGTYKASYGALYNWNAVYTGKLAPKGWHVPSMAEWDVLVNYLGGFGEAGGKIMETGTAHWTTNDYATNISGFTALPGGYCDGGYLELGTFGIWWSSKFNENNIKELRMQAYMLTANSVQLYSGFKATSSGYSVRCIKD